MAFGPSLSHSNLLAAAKRVGKLDTADENGDIAGRGRARECSRRKSSWRREMQW